jgi:DNA-binding GntR family transcriptional regulator
MEPVRNRGFKVVPVTFEDVRHIHDIRLMLEVPAMRELARRHAEFALDSFRDIANSIVSAAAEGDVNGYLLHDRDFHLGLTDLLGNKRLSSIIGNLRDQTRLFGLHGLSDAGQLVSSAAEHLDILDALESGDDKLTEKLMRKHLGHIVREWAGDMAKERPLAKTGFARS